MSNTPNTQRRGDEGERHRGWWLALGSALAYWLWRRWRGGERHPEASSVPTETLERGHEGYATSNARGIAASGVGLLVATVLVLVVLVGLFNGLADWRVADVPPASRFAGAVQTPPAPRLQEDPAVDLRAMHAYENRLLYEYGWVSREAGVVRIPIGRAMDLIAERGLPVRATGLPDTALVPTESGFTLERTGPPLPTSPAYLGSSLEPYTPSPEVARALGLFDPFLLRPGGAVPSEQRDDGPGAHGDAPVD